MSDEIILGDENPNGSNPTRNPSLADIIHTPTSRRGLMRGALGLAAMHFFAGRAFAGVAARVGAAAQDSNGILSEATDAVVSRLGFTQIAPNSDDAVTVPAGYRVQVLVPWGTPLWSNVPAFQEDASNTAADQEGQVGFNHDGMHFFPIHGGQAGNRRGLLVVNHEYTDANQIYSAAQGSTITNDAAGREKVQKALAGHGVSVIEIRRDNHGNWSHVVDSPFNRRVTGNTPVHFSGPVPKNHPMLQSNITGAPRGTLNNCAHGVTPWGTYLACEENWNGYFGTDDPTWTPTPLEARYGVSRSGFGYNWHRAEPRFDLAVNRNELNHFGWCVEINPLDPQSTPVKRTALGRFKHEGATCTESRGRVVVYSGDDENGDYFYKYVSNRPWRQHRARNESPLDHGVLYVAQFDANGAGRWIPLVHGQGALTVANGWVDQADVLLRTRMAADAVGATRLHRPEWVTVEEQTGFVYLTLTNGSGNGAPVNSNRDPNPYGHIVRFRETRGDHTETDFQWEVFLLAGDSAYDPAVPANQAIFGSPDGVWSDNDGILWIQTDISNSSQNRADRGYNNIGNNMMLACDPRNGDLRRFLVGPRGCEITGVCMTPDMRTMFCNVQHPGESTTFWNNQAGGAPTVQNPTRVSSWPFGSGRRPRPATLVITRIDGGKIGQ